jgi:hypothetical protein
MVLPSEGAVVPTVVVTATMVDRAQLHATPKSETRQSAFSFLWVWSRTLALDR